MDELIERLEKADGPNLALEWEIHITVRGLEGAGMYGKHPNYTASIDTALTLMPKGIWLEIETGTQRNGPSFEWPVVTCGRQEDGSRIWKGQAKTVPIALCIAAFKALAMSKGECP